MPPTQRSTPHGLLDSRLNDLLNVLLGRNEGTLDASTYFVSDVLMSEGVDDLQGGETPVEVVSSVSIHYPEGLLTVSSSGSSIDSLSYSSSISAIPLATNEWRQTPSNEVLPLPTVGTEPAVITRMDDKTISAKGNGTTNQINDEKTAKRTKHALAERRRRASLPAEERVAQRQKRAAAERRRVAALSEVEREAQRKKHAKSERDRRARMTEEQRIQHRERRAEALRRRRAALTPEERRLEKECHARAERQRRASQSVCKNQGLVKADAQMTQPNPCAQVQVQSHVKTESQADVDANVQAHQQEALEAQMTAARLAFGEIQGANADVIPGVVAEATEIWEAHEQHQQTTLSTSLAAQIATEVDGRSTSVTAEADMSAAVDPSAPQVVNNTAIITANSGSTDLADGHASLLLADIQGGRGRAETSAGDVALAGGVGDFHTEESGGGGLYPLPHLEQETRDAEGAHEGKSSDYSHSSFIQDGGTGYQRDDTFGRLVGPIARVEEEAAEQTVGFGGLMDGMQPITTSGEGMSSGGMDFLSGAAVREGVTEGDGGVSGRGSLEMAQV
ncbi:unnamed protein product [Choristocarpus tenellus]